MVTLNNFKQNKSNFFYGYLFLVVIVVIFFPSLCFCSSNDKFVQSQKLEYQQDSLLNWHIDTPIYEGILEETITNSNNKNNNDNSKILLKNILIDAHHDAQQMAHRQQEQTQNEEFIMKYSIFRGRSALRDVLENKHKDVTKVQQLLTITRNSPLPQDDTSVGDILQQEQKTNQHDHNMIENKEKTNVYGLIRDTTSMYRMCSILLLLKGYADVAHEVLLGVTPHNLKEAEYAATHPGQTHWRRDHPLSASADIIHSIIHRLEGAELGEGNHTGYENAKYWLSGGPKCLDRPTFHPIYRALVQLALHQTPLCVEAGVIAGQNGKQHTNIISDGGTKRTIFVPNGEWDGFTFINLCQQQRMATGTKSNGDDTFNNDKNDEKDEKEQEELIGKEIAFLQRAELLLLLRSELIDCLEIYRKTQ